MIDALRADPEWLRQGAATNEQRALLEAHDPRASNGAMWAETEKARDERSAGNAISMRAITELLGALPGVPYATWG